MKKNLLIASLLLTGAANAQFTQSNEPAIGNAQAMYELEESADPYASFTGSGQTWDYSGYFGIDNSPRTFSISDPASTPEGSSFPSATKAIEIEGFMTSYISSTASTRNSQGFSFEAGSPMGTVNAVLENDNELLMNYPMALNNSLVDVFSGTAYTDAGNFPTAGNGAAKVDGEGTLILNASTTHTGVLRYMITDTAEANLGFLGTAEIIRTQYEYYKLGTNNDMPLFIHTTMAISVSGGAPSETVYALSSAAPDGYLSVSENTLTGLTVYPNPAQDHISVNGLKDNASLTLVDAQGKTVATSVVEPAAASMNIGQVKAGIYFLHIISGNASTVERVVVR